MSSAKTEIIQYLKHEGGTWEDMYISLHEKDWILEYINQIETPVRSGYITLPVEQQVYKNIFIYALKFEGTIWDTQNGWRL